MLSYCLGQRKDRQPWWAEKSPTLINHSRLDGMSADLSDTTLYFGYGSNLWRQQMKQRCPTSEFLGIARLDGYRWIIYERGYANIVEMSEEDGPGADSSSPQAYEDQVWGLVYSLQSADEARLDRNEGVPFAYTKETLDMDFFPTPGGRCPWPRGEKAKRERMLVYINRDLTDAAEPKHEYIYRMNRGIRDALREGVPEPYVEKVIRKFIPDVEDKTVEDLAKQQALDLEDER
ncbi:Gamma-glutamyl cyclotransferase, AIG2-like [Teratosphaeria destructans]|uniref:gamma-glutamylcyclotransferase n=1 Tax=Teratosphaeria destructans TaxID=418781 RepID=A0A9W7SN91_9PEZI|nr:Gamma-glutamyl cyclotransferase, AIG2-like [Teratosphaeria destructans]